MVANEIGVGGECRPVNNRKFEVGKKTSIRTQPFRRSSAFEQVGVEFPEGEPPRLRALDE